MSSSMWRIFALLANKLGHPIHQVGRPPSFLLIPGSRGTGAKVRGLHPNSWAAVADSTE